MPRTQFPALPPDARLWVFAADAPLTETAAGTLLAEVDQFLDAWQAHGAPLSCARDWRDDRFLAVAVDQRSAGASGCSIDGLFRTLQRIGPSLGASLLPSGRVFWRAANGDVQGGDRAAFIAAAKDGSVGANTPAFDTTILTAGEWRTTFEKPVADSWHRSLLPSLQPESR
jgi:hypothetical protein